MMMQIEAEENDDVQLEAEDDDDDVQIEADDDDE